MKAETIRETQIIRVRVRSDDPQRARELAAAVTERFVPRASEQVSEQRKIISEQLAQIDGQLAKVDQLVGLSRTTLLRLQQNPSLNDRPRGLASSFALNAATIAANLREGLLQTRAQLRGKLVSLALPSLVEAPTFPQKPVAPRKVQNVVITASLGVIAGIIASLIVDALSVTVPLASAVSSPAVRLPRPQPQKTHSSE